MSRRHLRYWTIPLAVAAAAALLAAGTRAEQEAQADALRDVFANHARFVGNLVREASQEAAWSTGLAFEMSSDALTRLIALLGAPGLDEDCGAVASRLPEVRAWAAREPSGVRGCIDRIPEPGRQAFVDGILAAPDPSFVDDARTRAAGMVCAADPASRPPFVLCLDREHLDRMRREVGLGPLLAGLVVRDLDYVVVQDAGGLLAASPAPGDLSSFGDDPVLAEVLEGPPDGLRGRMIRRDGRPVFEALAPLELADGSRALVRMAMDASELDRLDERIARRQAVMGAVLSAAVLMAFALAWVLSRGARRRAEYQEALRRQQEEARHWQSLGQMAATVAHEVRNPLNTIGMALQRLAREVRPDPSDEAGFRELLDLSSVAADRVERVVGEFLDLGRPLALDVRECPADELLREALAPLELRSRTEGCRLVVEASCPGLVDADRRRFAQALGNLVGNAMDAAGGDGTVRVRAACDASAFRVDVEDDGPGMDAATLERALTPFGTTKANGTGLGLPLARRLVEAHGGRLEIATAPGRGTTASIVLPRRVATAGTAG